MTTTGATTDATTGVPAGLGWPDEADPTGHERAATDPGSAAGLGWPPADPTASQPTASNPTASRPTTSSTTDEEERA